VLRLRVVLQEGGNRLPAFVPTVPSTIFKNKLCEDCGCFIEEPEFIVNDLYNYNARPQRAYHRLDHFKEVLGQFQGREGKTISPEILHQIKYELPEDHEATAVDVKKVMRKLKLTKYMENFYFILFTVTGKQPP
jgi:hypothetical protein